MIIDHRTYSGNKITAPGLIFSHQVTRYGPACIRIRSRA